LGRQFGQDLTKGSIAALRGDLGAGKTQFVKGVVGALGSPTQVTSPTFTLIHEYAGGRLPVYHFDFFRIESGSAAARLGLDDYLFGDGISIIEWADKFPELIPPSALWVRLTSKGEMLREITM
jgi:tRNA threonylcarbamoyladenosine biosynthesis protein TsaE